MHDRHYSNQRNDREKKYPVTNLKAHRYCVLDCGELRHEFGWQILLRHASVLWGEGVPRGAKTTTPRLGANINLNMWNQRLEANKKRKRGKSRRPKAYLTEGIKNPTAPSTNHGIVHYGRKVLPFFHGSVEAGNRDDELSCVESRWRPCIPCKTNAVVGFCLLNIFAHGSHGNLSWNRQEVLKHIWQLTAGTWNKILKYSVQR